MNRQAQIEQLRAEIEAIRTRTGVLTDSIRSNIRSQVNVGESSFKKRLPLFMTAALVLGFILGGGLMALYNLLKKSDS